MIDPLCEALTSAIHPLMGAANDYDSLLHCIGDARYVLLGEATHGSHEFYRERARITRRLIAEKQFSAVAVEADWPDAHRVNRYVLGTGSDRDGNSALAGFTRFPQWMWRNKDVLDFIEWLRGYNASLPESRPRIGFYGLDLYSLFTSIDEVVRYLERVDSEAARDARKRYACFDRFDKNIQRYGHETGLQLAPSCEEEVMAQLQTLRERGLSIASESREGQFYAEQNARLVRNAEEYYRSLIRGHIVTWNLRDGHMAETLEELALHLERLNGRPAKIVVWEHNSHIGNAHATEQGRHGEWNLGQLTRKKHGDQVALIGFTTYHGTVTAATHWGGPAQRRHVRPALAESYEALFHHCAPTDFMLPLKHLDPAAAALYANRLERAIGVIYSPETERHSHYFYASLPRQFDAVLHFDETHAVEPLATSSYP